MYGKQKTGYELKKSCCPTDVPQRVQYGKDLIDNYLLSSHSCVGIPSKSNKDNFL